MTTPKPTEHKSVQARILKYADEIGWTIISQSEAEQRRGFDPSGVSPRQLVPIIVSSTELNNIIFNYINKNSYLF